MRHDPDELMGPTTKLRNTVLNLHRLAGAANIAEACRITAFSAHRGLNMLTEHVKPQIASVLVNSGTLGSNVMPAITWRAERWRAANSWP